MFRILAINPGATSTKIAIFDESVAILRQTIEHQGDALKAYANIIAQFDYRKKLILDELVTANISLDSINAVVGRGGLLKPIAGGTYLVNDVMLADLKASQRGEHASNLGAILADSIARLANVQAYIVDPVSVDEMAPEARLSGLPELPRVSMSHALNSKAVAHRAAHDLGKRYEDINLVVAHLGTGVSVTPHLKGKMIDVNNAQEEGPFSPDRTGGLPTLALAKLCYSGKYTAKAMYKMISGEGGMYAYLGTRDARQAEDLAKSGDAQADLVLKAMAYQTAKAIGGMAAVLSGDVDQIVLTGGLAYSKLIVDLIIQRVKFIAPVVVYPGEAEMDSLAAGTLRVLAGQEAAKIY
ncbi:MAG: butyrate kinase [Eubacteriales bacterium]|nr:butyrate kinase [Eubacteriales bacterium]